MKGTPGTMQSLTQYSNILEEINLYFGKKISQLNQLGVLDIILDPGFGFAKTTDQNFYLLKKLKAFQVYGYPVLVGISRKSLIYKTLDLNAADSLNGTTVLNTIALLNGARILRVHDALEAQQAVQLLESYNGVIT